MLAKALGINQRASEHTEENANPTAGRHDGKKLGRVFSLSSSGGYAFRVKAPEDWRSPKAVANFEGSVRREASWIAPVLWRFLTGAMALNTSGGERWGEEVVRW